jgi:hypothetical protein
VSLLISISIEDDAQIVEEKDQETKKKKRTQIFPRYHQLPTVKVILADMGENAFGHNIVFNTQPFLSSLIRLVLIM